MIGLRKRAKKFIIRLPEVPRVSRSSGIPLAPIGGGGDPNCVKDNLGV